MKPRYGHPSDPSRRIDVTQRVAAFMNGHENVGSAGSGSVACIWAMASPVPVPLSRHMTVTVQPCPRVKLNAEAWRIAAAELLSQLEVQALTITHRDHRV